MTDKRFTKRTIDNWESYIVDNETGEEYGTKINPLLDLLNELHEENERLKEENQKLAQELQETEGLIAVLKEMVLENGNERTS